MFWTYILRQCIGFRFLWFPPLIYTRSALSLGFVLGSLLLLVSSLASAEQITLAWDDPNNNAAEVGSYRLYYWQPTWEMPASVEVGLQTTYTLTNLEAGQTYTFAITVHDGQGDRESLRSNEVSMTFPPPNTPPIAYDGTLSTAAGTPGTGTLRATDADGDALTYRLLSTGSQGTAMLADATTGAYTYTPQPQTSGTDTFTFQVNDGTVDSNEATVTVTVASINTAPVAYDGSLNTAEDTPVSGALRASDADGDTLTYRLIASSASPQVTLAWDDPNNNAAEVGGYRIYYWQPTWEMPTSVEVGRQLSYTATGLEAGKTYAFAVTVHDGAGGRESILSNEVHTTVDGQGTHTHGTVTLTNATTGTYTYTPPPQTSGTDTFSFQVNDGTVDSNVATVMVTISPTNHAPVAAPDNATTPEDTAITLAVLANDTDVDGNALTVTAVSPATAGTATTDGTTVTYTPDPDVSGTDTVTYTVSDGSGGMATGTVTITVTPVNDIPVATADSTTTPAATAVTLNVLANDTDVDGDALTVTAVSPATAGTATTDGTAVTYTPNVDFHGTDTLAYTVSDGSGGTAIGTVTIAVRSANLPPVAYDGSLYTTEDIAVSGALRASDDNGDALTYRLVASSATPQVTLAWDDPHNDPTEVGGYRIYYWQPYWEMPASVDIGPHTSHTLTGLEAGQPYTFAITVHDGQGGRESTLSNEISTPGVSPASGPHGTVTLTDATTGAYTYTPPPQATGTDTFTFQVNDGTVDSNVATVRVTITSPLDEVIDTDGDGLPDDVERDVYGTDPLLADTDADGVADGEELDLYGTDPLLADTDADGIPDGEEIAAGTDPTAPDDSASLSLWHDYQVTMLLRSDDNDALGVLFRYQDPNNYYRFSWDRQRAYRRLVKCENGTFTLLAEDNVRYVSRRTYQLQIVAQGPHLEVWIDNKQIFAVTDTSFEQGTLALYSWGNAGSQFEAVRVETFPMEVVLLAIGTHDGPSANWTVIDEGTVAGPSAWAVEQNALVQTANIYSEPSHRSDLAKLGTFALYEIVDTDGDGLPDDVERDVYGTDPFLADTDVDGLEDGEELEHYDTDPLLADTE